MEFIALFLWILGIPLMAALVVKFNEEYSEDEKEPKWVLNALSLLWPIVGLVTWAFIIYRKLFR